MSDGEYLTGKVVATRWQEFVDKKTHVTKPIFNVTVEVGSTEASRKVRPSVFIDNQILDFGPGKGKTRMEDVLEILNSYDIPVNMDSISQNDPFSWGDQLMGKEVSVFVKTDDEGNEKAYLNRASKPELEASRVRELWAALSDGKPEPSSSAADTGLDDDDDIPFGD